MTAKEDLCFWFCVAVGWLFSLMIWFELFLIVDSKTRITGQYWAVAYFFLPALGSYVLHLILLLVMANSSIPHIKHKIKIPLEEYIVQLLHARPTCWLKVECHHRGSKGKRVVTKREREEFQFASYRSGCTLVVGEELQDLVDKYVEEEEDEELEYVSFNSQCEEKAESSSPIRLNINKVIIFPDERAERACDEQMDSFIRRHISDAHQRGIKELSIPDCYDHVLVVPIPGKTTFVYSPAFYYLCVLLTFGIPYITFFYLSTKFVDLVVKKELSLTQNDDDIHQQV
eukprot:TRINITY_DN1518_c0_g1_i1.p1 TRINITY_DN1518_c0_g1~~TRINITY_DN1518_c0_g1_i1.p1  ORF type:complete len:286 (+),score=19.01 TRINITY_DN1518_c0_g1_i1:57-914(+)